MKNLKIELGTINGNTTEEAQALAQKLFGDLPAIGPYKNLYLSVPHLKSWKESKPEHPSKTTIEMYIFSSPDDSTSCQYYETSTPYNLKGKSYTFLHNQADRITTFEPYEDYDEMADDAGVPLAYRKDNRVWILMDMFHDIHNEAPIADFMTELVKFLEGREHYGLDYVSLIVGASSQIGKDTLRKLKMDAKQGELDCITSQDTYVKYCKEMVQRNKRVDDFKILDKKDMKVMAERLLNHKFIAKIMPYEGDDGIVIITK